MGHARATGGNRACAAQERWRRRLCIAAALELLRAPHAAFRLVARLRSAAFQTQRWTVQRRPRTRTCSRERQGRALARAAHARGDTESRADDRENGCLLHRNGADEVRARRALDTAFSAAAWHMDLRADIPAAAGFSRWPRRFHACGGKRR